MKAGVLGTLTPVIATTYDPWWAQRMFHRSRAAVRVIVAGRQSGKTHAAAREVVQIMLARPKTTSCLLMPILKTSTGTQTHVRNALEEALGSEGGRWTWHEQKKCWTLWNGSVLHLRCIDTDAKKGVAVRGLTIDGVLWVDEAAYVPKSAWESACATQLAVTDPLAIVTTTPCGMNWVYEESQAGTPGQGKKPSNESFRFRSSDSPFVKAAKLAEMRERYGQKRADQEINAVFFGDGGTVFPLEHIHRMLVPVLEHRGEQWTMGIDLAKERDFTVVTIMNEFGEAWIRWRVRHTDRRHRARPVRAVRRRRRSRRWLRRHDVRLPHRGARREPGPEGPHGQPRREGADHRDARLGPRGGPYPDGVRRVPRADRQRDEVLRGPPPHRGRLRNLGVRPAGLAQEEDDRGRGRGER
jgi:hypothetical protein